MLLERYANWLGDMLISQAEWHPHPTMGERDAWQAARFSVRKAHLRCGEEALDFGQPVAPATLRCWCWAVHFLCSTRSSCSGPRR